MKSHQTILRIADSILRFAYLIFFNKHFFLIDSDKILNFWDFISFELKKKLGSIVIEE